MVIFATAGSLGMTALVVAMALQKTGVKIEGRYFVPCVPLAIVWITALWPRRSTRETPRSEITLRGGALVATALLIWVGGVAFGRWLETGNEPQRIAAILKTPWNGATIRQDLLAAGADGRPVLSNQSQALYSVLRQPTLGVPEKRLTPRLWTADSILALGRTFGARRLVIFKTMPLGETDGSSDFVLPLARSADSGLVLLTETADVSVFEISPGGATQSKIDGKR